MKLKDTNIWLFSFADLAFLLLIAFTQASTIGKAPVNIGEMSIPKVVDSPDIASITQQKESYQIRVHRPSEDDPKPFQLVSFAGTQETSLSQRLSAAELRDRLIILKQKGTQRPILVPDEFSLSKDMLMSMSIIEKVWTDSKWVTVNRVHEIEENIK